MRQDTAPRRSCFATESRLSVTADQPEAGLAGRMVCDLSEDGVSPDTAEDFMVVAMAGPIAGDLGTSLSEWPLDPESSIGDNRALAVLAGFLGLDESVYREVVDRAFRLAAEPDFVQLVRVIGYALERLYELDQEQIRFLIGPDICQRYGIVREAAMEHLAVKAATQTTTDQGTFTALASTYSEDRGGDVVEPGAFGGTIARWKQTGKQIPLHWITSPRTPPTSSARSPRLRCKRQPMACWSRASWTWRSRPEPGKPGGW